MAMLTIGGPFEGCLFCCHQSYERGEDPRGLPAHGRGRERREAHRHSLVNHHGWPPVGFLLVHQEEAERGRVDEVVALQST